MWHDSFICEITNLRTNGLRWRVCGAGVWLDSLIHAPWLIYTWHDSFTCELTHSCVTWLIHIQIGRDGAFVGQVCDLTHLNVHYQSFICDMTHSYVTWILHIWHDSFMCYMTHPYINRSWRRDRGAGVWHDSFECVQWLIKIWHDSLICAPWLTDM